MNNDSGLSIIEPNAAGKPGCAESDKVFVLLPKHGPQHEREMVRRRAGALTRMVWLMACLERGQLTQEDYARRFGRKRRSFYRDLCVLREAGFVIAYDLTLGVWRTTSFNGDMAM